MENDIMITPPPGGPTSTINTAPEKYSLSKKFEIEEELKIYFMGVIANPIMIQNDGVFRNKNVGVVSYNHGAALKKAMEIWGANGNIAINSHNEDFTTIKDILKMVNIEGVTIQNIVPEAEKPRLMPLENFKNSLLLASDEYIKSEKDKMVLKKIIATI